MPIILYVDVIMDDCIHALKLSGIRRYANMCGWDVVLCSERQSRPERLAKLLSRYHPIGCIVECSANHTDLPPTVFGNIPVVYLDCSPRLYGPNVHKVMHRGEAMARMAFNALSENKPSSYAVVDYHDACDWTKVRVGAFYELAKASGKDCRVFARKTESPRARFNRLSKWMADIPPRSAVFAVNDYTATEVVAAAKVANRKIPQEMTLIGVDNLKSLCEQGDIHLSSVQIDFERAGYTAANRLKELLFAKSDMPAADWFDPLMVVRRKSTSGAGRYESYIPLIVERIRREAVDGLTVRDAIAGFGGSRRLLEIRFREALGHSILNEIQHVRMERVCFLLSTTTIPIGTIASMCGYRSDIALHKAFRQQTGVCMREWRKQNGLGA